MHDFFFGPLAVTMWFVAAAIFAFCATYVWWIVFEVGGVRGAALAITFTCCAIICCCFGLILSDQEWISTLVLGALVTAAWPPIVICALVLTDIYSADRNNHRSFTARSYLWYKRAIRHEGEERGGHHPITVNR
jgi:hypothetical protein